MFAASFIGIFFFALVIDWIWVIYMRAVADKRPGDELPATEHRLRASQDFAVRRVVEQVDEPGIHVDRRSQSGLGGTSHMCVEGRPIDFT